VSSAVTCGGRCGTQTDYCARAVDCGRCPTGGCAGSPCGPGGTCTATGASTYTCACFAGYVSNGVTCLPE
jgi:hypothetical protein